MESNISNSINEINKIYNKLSYFDIYGGSVLLFVVITLVVFSWYTYFSLMTDAMAIKADWVNQRCNPKVMPFAGLINKPDNKTITEFTGENFTYCTQSILTNLTGVVIQPFQYLTNFILSIFQGFLDAINQVRNVFDKLRINMREIAENVLQRIMNVMIPLQQIFSALNDSLQKAQGVLAASLFTALGSYYTLKSLMGAIVELIIEILIILLGIIVGLWVVPFTWPAAASMSAIFLAISIPLALVVVIMTEVLHIKSSGIPTLSCFDKDTMILLNNNKSKKIKDLRVGDYVMGNNKITGTLTLLSDNETMYDYKGIIVSGSHRVLENNEWIYIKNSPLAVIRHYNKPFIYCLLTENKRICIQDTEMLDWDEIVDVEQVKKIRYGGFSDNFSITLYNGVSKLMKYINPGDILKNGAIVYGVVKIDSKSIRDCYRINLGNFSFCYGEKNLQYMFLGNYQTSTFQVKENNPPDIIYHLLTNTGSFKERGIEIRDYNSMSENLLTL